MKRLAYLIGEPGVGKSAVANELTCNLRPELRKIPGLTLTDWRGEGDILVVTELGWRKPGFPGTDTLSMPALPAACDWIRSCQTDVFGEGDRLAHPKFWSAAQESGYAVVVFALVDTAGAVRRRTQRAHELGIRQQSDSWVRGRRTRVANLQVQWPCTILRMDELTVAEAADTVQNALV